MPQRYLFAALLVIFTTLASIDARAEIYKCVAANGELTYSQTPCPEKDSKVTVQKSDGRSGADSADCQYAHRFALATAQEMQAGTDSSTVFDRYGGLGSLSNGSVSLISYVFQFRTNDDVSVERVAALSNAKCQARAFGDVTCEQLPVAFTNRLGGCEADDESRARNVLPFPTSVSQPTQLQSYSAPQESGSSQQARYRDTRAREEEKRLECKERIRSQIDAINSQMRSGYSGSQGDSMRRRRRDLEQKMRDC